MKVRTFVRALVSVSVLSALSLSVAQANVDNRAAQSPVRNQKARGTCAAFAVAGALEAFPGMPTELSVQYLYAVMKKTQMQTTGGEATEGDLLSRYVPVLQSYGVPAEHFLPYAGSPDNDSLFCQMYHGMTDPVAKRNMSFLCQARITDDQFLKVSPYGKYHIGSDTEVLKGADAANVEKIKAILDEQRLGKWVRSIPVSYTVLASQWSDALNRGRLDVWDRAMIAQVQTTTGVISLPAAQARETGTAKYNWDLERLLQQGWVKFVPSNPSEAWAGHAVQIVGYDDTGFIIKNSWGTEWGEQGYGHVSFDYHRVFATEALVIHSAWTKMPSANANPSFLTDFRLKSFYDPQSGYLSVSSYTMEIQDPFLYRVEYQILAQDAQGKWRPLGKPFVSTPFETPEYWRQGYGGDFFEVRHATPANIAIQATYFLSKETLTRYFFGVGAAGMHDLAGKILPVP